MAEQKEKKLDNIRHSLAHLLAAAVLKEFPKAKLGIGPVIENGFYYDFYFPADKRGSKRGLTPITPEHLPRLEATMRELIKAKLPFVGVKVTAAEAKKIFKTQPFKLDLVKEFSRAKQVLTVYFTGHVSPRKSAYSQRESAFLDLCRGGHAKNTSEINPDAFKLEKIAGAYWRGNEKNPQLQRIYGLAFAAKKELDDYLVMMEEAKKRDHRKLGQDLDLFIFRDEVGPGLPLFTEKGATILREMERFIVDEEIKRGYRHVYTPDLARVKLYEISGHYPYYKDIMYPVMQVDEDRLVLRPMSCPHHFMLYSARPRSYKELPLKIAEMAKLYRYERSGELTGLMRARVFCLADAHIFCAREQAVVEIKKAIELIDYAVGELGLVKNKDYAYRLSLGDPKNKKKYYNNPKGWREGEAALRRTLQSMGISFIEAPNEAAFYGPKIDIQMKNIVGKEETAFTIQYDFCLPARFGLSYINSQGQKEQPIVIHRSSIGALERTMAFLIEHYAGAFPFWLAPVQVKIIPVADRHLDYAKKVAEQLKNYRVEIAEENETVGKKIRNAELQKIPYVMVVGDIEEKNNTIRVRERQKGDLGEMAVGDFVKSLM